MLASVFKSNMSIVATAGILFSFFSKLITEGISISPFCFNKTTLLYLSIIKNVNSLVYHNLFYIALLHTETLITKKTKLENFYKIFNQ